MSEDLYLIKKESLQDLAYLIKTKSNMDTSKEDLKFVDDLTKDWGIGNSYIDPIDFTYRNDEAEG